MEVVRLVRKESKPRSRILNGALNKRSMIRKLTS